MVTPASLENLETDEQRRILDTVGQVRKCGLERTLSLPQLVVCGDQSAGKSSVLEALTEIPFPRNDNLCTRFATEISLRRAPSNSLTIKVIPGDNRSAAEKKAIQKFEESISNFDDLPKIMDRAMAVMGIANDPDSDGVTQAFSRDVLSIVIEGPSRPQLTLVDIPGLIATHTKGTTSADVDLVAQITDDYIQQQRTICLAVVSATSDYANQKILEKVREVDKEGDRTLGIITKPDRLEAGSGSEKSFIGLARNEDVFFKLGWHVLKNRSFEQRDFEIQARNMHEATFFQSSNFKCLPKESVGIDALRRRLSDLLFEHVKRELPNLRDDLEKALVGAQQQLDLLGEPRSSVAHCKKYLTQLSLDYYEISKAAVNGHYEGAYFHTNVDHDFSVDSPSAFCRTRAVVQNLNAQFSDDLRKNGHSYYIDLEDDGLPRRTVGELLAQVKKGPPVSLKKKEALDWVRKVLARTRGKELAGNFNPLLVGELFWEQSTKWRSMAVSHIEQVSHVCRTFLKKLLHDKAPQDVETRVWFRIEETLKTRSESAFQELDALVKDLTDYPINYNHYYTDSISRRRQDRQKEALSKSLEEATTKTLISGETYSQSVDVAKVVAGYSEKSDPDMENFSCEEALDCLLAIYKVFIRSFLSWTPGFLLLQSNAI
jgi:GTPase SAR1 family protein